MSLLFLGSVSNVGGEYNYMKSILLQKYRAGCNLKKLGVLCIHAMIK